MALRKAYTISDQPNRVITGWRGYQRKLENTMMPWNVLAFPSINCSVPDGDKVVPDKGRTLLGQEFTASKSWPVIGRQKRFTNNNGDDLEVRVTKTNDASLKDVIEVLYTNPLTGVKKFWQVSENVNPIPRGAHRYYFTSWFDTNLEGISLNISKSIWVNGNTNVMSCTFGIAPIGSLTGTTLTLSTAFIAAGKTWVSLGFVDPLFGGSGKIVVNGVVYTATAGWGTSTLVIPGGTTGISVNDLAFDRIVVDSIATQQNLVYTTGTKVFAVGETVTGGTSSAYGIVTSNQQGSFMILQGIVGTFVTGETITGGTSTATGTVSSYTPSMLSFDVCSSFKNYIIYGNWTMRNFYMSNNYNSIARQAITNTQAVLNDLVVSGSYTGTGQHVYRVTIDSVHPAVNNQTFMSTQGGTSTSYFITSEYTGTGNNFYKIVIISDSYFTPVAGFGSFDDGELIVGQTSGAVLKVICGGNFAGGAAITQYISGIPVAGENFLGVTSIVTRQLFAFKFSNCATLYKNGVQITNLTGMFPFPPVSGVLQFATTGNQIVTPSQIDGLQFFIVQLGGNIVGDYYTLNIQSQTADTFQVQVDGNAPLPGETGIPIVPATAVLTYTILAGVFQVGERVTDSNGSTGIISSNPPGTLNLIQIIGAFGIGNTITGQQSSATATVVTFVPTFATQQLYQINPNGVLIQFVNSVGHTIGDFWDITVNQAITKAWINFYYTVPTRRPFEGYIGLLPSNFWAEIQQEDMMYVNDAHGGWSTIETKLSADLKSEAIIVSPLKATSQSKCIFPYMLGQLDNNIIYVNTEKKLEMIGRKKFLQLPQIGHLSDPVKLDFLEASFEDGGVESWDQKFWISSPKEGIMFCYDNAKKYWQPPKMFPEMGILSVVTDEFGRDMLIAHSNTKNQTFTMFNGASDNGNSYTVRARTPSNSLGNRWNSKETTMSFIEGYITGSPKLIHRVYLEPSGCGGIFEHAVEPIVCVIPDRAPFGAGPFGSHSNGSDIFLEGSYFQEIYKSYKPVLNYYFIALELECTASNHTWALLSMGVNSVSSVNNNKNLTTPSTVIR